MDNSTFAAAIQKEWTKFLHGRRVDPGIVQPYIFDSWLRCRSHGLDPNRFSRTFVSSAELQSKQKAQDALLAATSQVMRVLFEENLSGGLLATLYDPEGVLLFSQSTGADFGRLSLQNGALIKEELSGTNAVSMCIQEKKAIETCGAEHYSAAFHNCFCCSVPVWQGKEFQGVLNFTLPVSHFHANLRNLIRMATHAISEHLQVAAALHEQHTMLEALGEGVILLDDAGNIQAMNSRALQMCGRKNTGPPAHVRDIIATPQMLDEALAPGRTMKGQPATLRCPAGTGSCTLSLEKLRNGSILVLREAQRGRPVSLRSAGARPQFRFEDLKGRSPAHRQMLELAKIATQSDITTLIMGESGTGKELVAQAIHNGSSRASGPFVPVNCGALPPDLVQSELFGYDEGAFTGAAKAGKPGKFELADNGTIFLDEIGEMPLAAQVSLLRLIQNGEVTRIGGKCARQVNVRIIAATNKNLFEAIRKKEFREDLFYRLNIFSIPMPPLRAKPEDIPLLAEYFLERVSAGKGQKPVFAPGVLDILQAYAWPGNIRELENAVARMAFLATGSEIGLDLVPEPITGARSGGGGSARSCRTLDDNERECILQAIRNNRGNLRAAAKALGISRSGLYVKMRRMGISPAESRSYDH